MLKRNEKYMVADKKILTNMELDMVADMEVDKVAD